MAREMAVLADIGYNDRDEITLSVNNGYVGCWCFGTHWKALLHKIVLVRRKIMSVKSQGQQIISKWLI